MVEDIVSNMNKDINSLKEAILLDIEDVKQANHEGLLKRNDYKIVLIDNINSHQESLNQALVKVIENGIDIENYRDTIDDLEDNLKELYKLNKKLGSIVLPVKQMYSEIISEIEKQGGGNILEISV